MPAPAGGLFLTGTDTGVGKTWVAVRLVRALRARGIPALPLKPVESGVAADADPAGTDAGLLAAAAGLDDLDAVVRFRLRAPVAPALAAAREGVDLRLAELTAFCRRDAPVVVEGAGGWRAPLAADGEVRDLARALGLPVLLVAADRLGAVSHTLLACDGIRAAGCRLAGVVLNRSREPEPDPENLPQLQARLEVPVWPTRPDRWLDAADERALLDAFPAPEPD